MKTRTSFSRIVFCALAGISLLTSAGARETQSYPLESYPAHWHWIHSYSATGSYPYWLLPSSSVQRAYYTDINGPSPTTLAARAAYAEAVKKQRQLARNGNLKREGVVTVNRPAYVRVNVKRSASNVSQYHGW